MQTHMSQGPSIWSHSDVRVQRSRKETEDGEDKHKQEVVGIQT